VNCNSCGQSNAPGSRFCGGCGGSLAEKVPCPGCGTENPAGQRFCNGCGQQLAVEPPEQIAEKIRAVGDRLDGERKQVTVLFADVAGSMDLAEQCGPELWRQIMDRFFAILSRGVHAFEGTVDKFTGDGIMALFGAPIAHEDHAQRACFAALQLNDDLAEFAAELRHGSGLSFSVRIGINSGEVVVGGIGEDLAMEYTAIGHTVGLAQRMEQIAAPGTAYLTEHTATLVEGYLALEDLGEFDLKGSSQALRVYELTGVGTARGRLDISRARGFSRFVGRADEMTVLENAFEKARSGEAQVIGVVGEPGVGKSRLCHEFVERWRAKGVPVYHTAGQAHAKSVPLMPVMELMRAYFEITDRDSEHQARERIAGKLLLLDESLVDDLPLIFDFLAIADPERPAPRMDPEAQRRQLFGVVKRLTRAQSDRQPGINLYEDLHWLDPASEAFLANQIDAVQGTRSLTIVNFRPEYEARWMSKSYYGQIAVAPLGPDAIEEMLVDMIGSHPSTAELPGLLGERAGGNPFFIEEVTRSLVESGHLAGDPGSYELVRAVDDAAAPASVQVLLSSRIDRLEETARRVLRTAAVIGKDFSQPVLAEVTELAPAELEEATVELIASGFVYEQELYPETIFTFKHPLTQEVAYGSQLGERRAADHAAAAGAIAARYPERHDELAALLARHWEEAGDALEAARWNARAATWTGTREPVQSHRHWLKVVELTDSLPEAEETAALGLAARIFTLEFAWRLGISHQDAERVFREAERMAAETGDIRSRAILTSVYMAIRGVNDGDVEAAVELGVQAVALAEETQDPVLHLTSAGSGYWHYLRGEFDRSLATFDRAIEQSGGDPTLGAGINFGCPLGYCLIFKSGALTVTGRLAEARECLESGMRLCAEQDDVELVGWGHMLCVFNAFYAGEPAIAIAQARQALDIAERRGDALSRVWAWTLLGLAELLQGRTEPAIAALERSLEMSRERRTAMEGNSQRLGWLAECHLATGDFEQAVNLAREGLNDAVQTGARLNEALAGLMLGRVLVAGAAAGAAGAEQARETLERALRLSRELGYAALEPQVHAELAELARLAGDQQARRSELQEALRLSTAIGATGHAERLEGELAAIA